MEIDIMLREAQNSDVSNPETSGTDYAAFLKSLFPSRYKDVDTTLSREELIEIVREDHRRDWEHLQTRNPI